MQRKSDSGKCKARFDCEKKHLSGCKNKQEPDLCRLNKAIASAGYCARRKADELIVQGKVKVNGILEVNLARKVSPSDILEVEGKILAAGSRQCSYILMNKPVQVVCTLSDPRHRRVIVDILPPEFSGRRLFPVGRLDYFSEGLLLLTDDGELAQRMTHPRYSQVKIYEVIVRGVAAPEALKQMANGMTLADGRKLLPCPVKAKPLANGDTLLRMELRQGINRQIRKMCAQLDLVILRLRRVAEGVLNLGGLKPGQCRKLSAQEVFELKKSLNMKNKFPEKHHI